MKVVVDYDLCEANALCMDCAPEVFRVEEDDTLTVLIEGRIPGRSEKLAAKTSRVLMGRRATANHNGTVARTN